MPLVRRTRATLRSAEFGFFGVWVKTRTHTPRFCGELWSAGLLVFVRTFSRPNRTNWLIVGIDNLSKTALGAKPTRLALRRSGYFVSSLRTRLGFGTRNISPIAETSDEIGRLRP